MSLSQAVSAATLHPGDMGRTGVGTPKRRTDMPKQDTSGAIIETANRCWPLRFVRVMLTRDSRMHRVQRSAGTASHCHAHCQVTPC